MMTMPYLTVEVTVISKNKTLNQSKLHVSNYYYHHTSLNFTAFSQLNTINVQNYD